MSDVIIIGGGIAGVSLAAKLSSNADVVLLEGEDAFGYHATGRSAAMWEKYYGNELIRSLTAASEEQLRTANALTPRGVMILADKDDAHLMPAFLAEADTVPLDLDEAMRMVPILQRGNIVSAALEKSGCDIDVDLLFQGYVSTAKSNGAQFISNAKVVAIQRSGGWKVTSSKGEFCAPIIVNAAGAWADEIAALAGVNPIGLRPFRRSVARIAAPDGLNVSDWPMLLSASESWYAKPDAGKWLISPAEEHPSPPSDVWADDMVLAEGLARYQDFVTPEVTRVEHSWAGLRSFVKDRSPVVGFSDDAAGFFWLAGQGGYGVQTAPAISDIAAAMLGGAVHTFDQGLVDAMSPDRPL